MMSPPYKLPSYVAELLTAERQAPRPSVEAERRVRARVAASLVATAGAATLAATTAHAAAAAGVAVKTGGLGALAAKLSVVAFSVGVLSTAGVVTYRHHAAVETKAKAVPRTVSRKPVARPRALAVPAEAPPAAMLPTEPPTAVAAAQASIAWPAAATEPPPVAPPTASAPTAPLAAVPPTLLPSGSAARFAPSPPVGRLGSPLVPSAGLAAAPVLDDGVETLAGESPLIETARARVGAGDAVTALTLLAEHARRFDRGQLAEEREALWVQALVRNGDAAAARARATAFEHRFPHSIQLPAVRAAVQSIR